VSYLLLPASIPGINKAVISFWFRVPQASIDAARAASSNLIPLLTFGPRLRGRLYSPVPKIVSVWHWDDPFIDETQPPPHGGAVIGTPTWTYSDGSLDDPTNIGLRCSGGTSKNVARLEITINMNDRADLSGLRYDIKQADFHYDSTGFDFAYDVPGSGWRRDLRSGRLTTIVDTSYIFNEATEFFWIDTDKIVAADHWHHLLLSFDIRKINTRGASFNSPAIPTEDGTSEYSLLWYALDDVNYDGYENLQPYYASDGGPGPHPNAILTRNAERTAGHQTQPANFWNAAVQSASYSYDPSPIATNPVGIPASNEFVERIHKVEMAELQIFTGTTLDTSVTANRRAFVDVDGKPVPPSQAQEFIGKRPEVLLHRTSNWKLGRNTGALGQTPEGEIIAAGQFTRQGVVNAYKPDPSLHGQQSPSVPGPVRLTRTAADAGL